MKLHKVTFVLLVIGGLNWGLEVFGWGIGSFAFMPEWLTLTVYALVALSAVYEIFSHKKLCRDCAPQGA